MNFFLNFYIEKLFQFIKNFYSLEYLVKIKHLSSNFFENRIVLMLRLDSYIMFFFIYDTNFLCLLT